MDDDVAVLLRLQLLDRLDSVTFQHRRVGPLRVVQGRGDDVLRHGVELVRELALARRPGLGESLVRLAAEQQRGGVHRLVELELVAFAAVDLERPAAVLEVLRAAGVFHDSVERNELGNDDLGHVVLLAFGMQLRPNRARKLIAELSSAASV